MGGWRVICWALILAAPFLVVPVALAAAAHGLHAGTGAWLGFTYVSGVSMFLGFFAWYRGLAIGPMAQVSQVQLVQPVLSIVWAALLLGEKLTWPTILGGAAVIVCAGVAVRIRLDRKAVSVS
jgi:drug/metabolite transporter (DMT)-like permease